MGMLNLIFPRIYNKTEASVKLLAAQLHLVEQEVGVTYDKDYLQEIIDTLTEADNDSSLDAHVVRLETDMPGRWIVAVLDPQVDLGAVRFTYDTFLSGAVDFIDDVNDLDREEKFKQYMARIALRVNGDAFRIDLDTAGRALQLFYCIEKAVNICDEYEDGDGIYIATQPQHPTVRALFHRPVPAATEATPDEA